MLYSTAYLLLSIDYYCLRLYSIVLYNNKILQYIFTLGTLIDLYSNNYGYSFFHPNVTAVIFIHILVPIIVIFYYYNNYYCY